MMYSDILNVIVKLRDPHRGRYTLTANEIATARRLLRALRIKRLIDCGLVVETMSRKEREVIE